MATGADADRMTASLVLPMGTAGVTPPLVTLNAVRVPAPAAWLMIEANCWATVKLVTPFI